MSAELGTATTPSEAGEAILREGTQLFGTDAAAVYLFSEPRGPLNLVAHSERDPRWVGTFPQVQQVPLDSDLPLALAARSRQIVSASSPEEAQARFPSLRGMAERGVPLTFVDAPMVVGDRLVGVLVVAFTKPRRFSEEELGWTSTLAQDCAMALDRTLLFETEQRARIEAQRANRAKDDFLTSVSEALRAPLTSIRAGVQLLGGRTGSRARCAEGLDMISGGLRAESRLVDGLIDLSHIVARELRMERKPVDLARLVRSCMDELRARARDKGVDLAARSRARATVLGDRDRLRQVICQLVTNAIRFTPRGGHVLVEMETGDRRAIVRVKDDGKGISPGELPHVFEAFRDPERATMDHDGLGISLAIAKYVADEHDGALRIESPGEGRGATGTLELPLANLA
jgi:signal transduction histidine kinase